MLRLKERKYVKPEVKSDKIDQSKGVFVGTKKKVMRLDLPNTKKSIFVKTLILESRLKAILELAEKGVNVELPLVDPNNEKNIVEIQGKRYYKEVIFLDSGTDLETYLKTKRPNSQERFKLALSLAKQVALMHLLGIHHGDLMPVNITVRKSEVYLIDFELLQKHKQPNYDIHLSTSFTYDIHMVSTILRELNLPEAQQLFFWQKLVNYYPLKEQEKADLLKYLQRNCVW